MPDRDRLFRFLFEDLGLRGNLVHLDASWRAVLDLHPYPDAVRAPLGEALAAVALLAATIKFDGLLILQAEGAGPLRTLVAQATHDGKIRGLARWTGEVPSGVPLAEQFGEGRLVLTIGRRNGVAYQGVVPLEGDCLSAALERYFRDSEQLPTRLWLSASATHAAGLLLQRLPGGTAADEDWERIGILAATLTPDELLGLSAEQLLTRLFHEEQVRLFEPEPIAFRCGCSRERIADSLRLLGEAEVDAILAEQGEVRMRCELCNREYRLDPVDARQLFSATDQHPAPAAHQ